MSVLKVFLCIFFVKSCLLSTSLCWKPIVGQATLTKSSYSFKHSHPALIEHGAETGGSISFLDETFGYDYDKEQQHLGKANFGEQLPQHCAVKKFAFNQDGTVHYENALPELNQFTICYWTRFTNHSGDHVLLTYSAKDSPRAIQFWVANSKNSSFISMAIKGQQMYRLNYPLRMRQWHHTCSSWNGKTGEWQVWMKAERIGRGFHNSLVGHKIPANGKLYSGGTSVTGAISQGLHFEITFVQIYRIALSAGKAHRDHKHHHVHHFDHEGQELSTTTKTPPIINRPQPMHSQLASGQIPTRVRLNLANPQQAVVPIATAGPATSVQFPDNSIPADRHSITINTNFVNGQINTGSRLVAQQLLGLHSLPSPRVQTQTKTITTAQQQFDLLSNPANVQFIDETETHIQFKRNADASKKTQTNKNLKKRGLVFLEDGSIVDDNSEGPIESGNIPFKFDGLTEFGDKQFKQDHSGRKNIEDEISEHDKEPAEDEVKAVMTLCSGCEVEPFQGAIVFAWKDVIEKMDNALKGSSVGGCGDF